METVIMEEDLIIELNPPESILAKAQEGWCGYRTSSENDNLVAKMITLGAKGRFNSDWAYGLNAMKQNDATTIKVPKEPDKLHKFIDDLLEEVASVYGATDIWIESINSNSVILSYLRPRTPAEIEAAEMAKLKKAKASESAKKAALKRKETARLKREMLYNKLKAEFEEQETTSGTD